MNCKFFLFVFQILFFFLFFSHCNPKQGITKREVIPAPEFPKRNWINSEPLHINQLRGKIVLLDFWTYCCINCLHVIPELKKLEAKWKKELVVIGVHSGKFPNEKNLDQLRNAVLKNEIEHPIVNDPDYLLWSLYGIRAWPTFILIDPEGNIFARKSGEGVYQAFDEIIANMVKDYDLTGKMDTKELKQIRPIKKEQLETNLSFPGKIEISGNGNELYISDTGNHKILVYNLTLGQFTEEIGGSPGFIDGNFQQARFTEPQGIRYKNDSLWVADTGNHSIRKIDLRTKKVSTIAGTLNLSDSMNVSQEPRSPWDLDFLSNEIIVAMAGNHQIWTIPTSRNKFFPLIGNGKENLIDGNAKEAELAQPSAVKVVGTKVYFLDSETSSLRVFHSEEKKVETLIGKGLFDFGDQEGGLTSARMQHPLGITHGDGKLFIADTYNHKIKVYDLKTGKLKTLAGKGSPDWKDGKFSEAYFSEPSDLVFREGDLFVLDTNNHSIRRLDLKKEVVETLELNFTEKLIQKRFNSLPLVKYETIGEEISPEAKKLEWEWKFPKGFIAKKESKTILHFETSNPTVMKLKSQPPEIQNFSEKKQIDIDLQFGEATLITRGLIEYCHETKPKICMTRNLEIRTKYKVKNSGRKEPHLSFEIPIH